MGLTGLSYIPRKIKKVLLFNKYRFQMISTMNIYFDPYFFDRNKPPKTA